MSYITYAIGDVHGEADRYRKLLEYISDLHAINYRGSAMKIIQIGDLVDRGPDSFAAIELAMELERSQPKNFIHLRGNHEQMMLDAIDASKQSAMDNWLGNGGIRTLDSYHHAGYAEVPAEHINWLRARKTMYCDKETKMVFVHAGIDLETFPNCPDHVRLWTRSPQFFASDQWTNENLEGWCVVHGHTPTKNFMPEIDGVHGRRINIDTGAVFGGRLTAAILAPGEPVRFYYA